MKKLMYISIILMTLTSTLKCSEAKNEYGQTSVYESIKEELNELEAFKNQKRSELLPYYGSDNYPKLLEKVKKILIDRKLKIIASIAEAQASNGISLQQKINLQFRAFHIFGNFNNEFPDAT
jgi:hypothetical protein